MQICLYTNTALPKIGGQELVVDSLARRFQAAGHEVVVLAPQPRSADRSVRQSVPYPVARHPRFCSTRWFVAWYAHWLAKLMREHRFDVIHCHSTYPCAYLAACCTATAGVPLVVTSHGDDLDCCGLLARKPQLRGRYVRALQRADAAIAISSFTEQRFREFSPPLRRIERIPNGVDLARFAALAPRPAALEACIRPGRYVLFLGRLERRKGADLLLDAFSMAADHSDVGLVIAGEGGQRPVLQSRAASLGLGPRVWMPGRVEGELKTYLLQNALCAVMPSRISEAFGLVVLESYACGRPVIGTRLPGLSDLIEHERTGLLVPPDDTAALAEALGRAIGRPELMDRLGRQCRSAAEQYDWGIVADRHIGLYEEMI